MSSQKEERGKRVQPHVLQPTRSSPSLVDGEPRPAGLFSQRELNKGTNGGEEGGGPSSSLFSRESLRTQASNPSSHYSGSMMMARDCDKLRQTQGLSLGKGPKTSVSGSWAAPVACHRYHSDHYVDADFLPGRSGVQRDIAPGVVREARLEGTVLREHPAAARAPAGELVPNPVRVVRGVSEAYCDEDFLGPPSAAKRIHDARFDGITSGTPRAAAAPSASVAVSEWQQRPWYRPVTLRGTIQGTPEFGYSTEDYYPRSMRSPKAEAKAAPASEGTGVAGAAGERFDAGWSNVVVRGVQPYRGQCGGVRVQMHTGQRPCLTGVRVCDKTRACLEKGEVPPEQELEVRHLSHLGDTMCFLGDRGDINTAEQYHSDDFWAATESCSAKMRAAKLATEATASGLSGTGAATGATTAPVKHVPVSEDEKRDRERVGERRAAPSSTTGMDDQKSTYGEVLPSTFADAKAGVSFTTTSAAPSSVAAVSELFDWDPDPAFTTVSGQLGRARTPASVTSPVPLSLTIPIGSDEQAAVATSPSQYCTPIRAETPRTAALAHRTEQTAWHETSNGPATHATEWADAGTLYAHAHRRAVDSEEDGFGDGEFGEHLDSYGPLLDETDTSRTDGSYSYISTPSAVSSTAWTSTPFAHGLRGRFPGRRAPAQHGYRYGHDSTADSVRGVGMHPLATCMASWDEGYDYYGLDNIMRQLEERGHDVGGASGAGRERGEGEGEGSRDMDRSGGRGPGVPPKKGGSGEDEEHKGGDRHERVGSADATSRSSSRYSSQHGDRVTPDAIGRGDGLHATAEDSSTPTSKPIRRRAAARPLSLRARPPWCPVRAREASADGVSVRTRRSSDDAADGLRGSRLDRAFADATKRRARVSQRAVNAVWSRPWTKSPSHVSMRSSAISGMPQLSTAGADAHTHRHMPTASPLDTPSPPHDNISALPLFPTPSVPAPGTSLSSIASLPLAYTSSLLSGTADVVADLAYAGVRAGEQALGAVTQAAAEVVAGARGAVGEVALVMGAGPHFLLKDGLAGPHAHLRSPRRRGRARRVHNGHISSRTHVRPRIRLFPLAGARGMHVGLPQPPSTLPPASPSPLPVEVTPASSLPPLEDISPRIHARAHAHANQCPHPDALSSLRCRCDVFPLERDAVEGEGGLTGLIAAMLPPQPRPRLPATRAYGTALAQDTLAGSSGVSALDADITRDARTSHRRGKDSTANGRGVLQRVARGGTALVRAGTNVSSALMSGHVAVAVSEVVDASVRGAARVVGVGVGEVRRVVEALVEVAEEAADAGMDVAAAAGEEMWGTWILPDTSLSADPRMEERCGDNSGAAARDAGGDKQEKKKGSHEGFTRCSHSTEVVPDAHTSVTALLDQICTRSAAISPSLCPHAARHTHTGRTSEHSYGLGMHVHEAVQGDDTLFSRAFNRKASAEDTALAQHLTKVRARVLSLGDDDNAASIAPHGAAGGGDVHVSSGSGSSAQSSPQHGSCSSATSSSASVHGRNEDAVSTPSDSDESRIATARLRAGEGERGCGAHRELVNGTGTWWMRHIGNASTVLSGMGTSNKTTARALLASLREDAKEDMHDAHGRARGMGWGMLVGGLRGGGDTRQERGNYARMGISAGKSASGGGKGGLSRGKRARAMTDESKSAIHDVRGVADSAANGAPAAGSGIVGGALGAATVGATARGSDVHSSAGDTAVLALDDSVAGAAESLRENARRRQVLCELKQDFIANTHKTLFPEEDRAAVARREPADHTAYQPFGYTYVSERVSTENSPRSTQVAAGAGESVYGGHPDAANCGAYEKEEWASDSGGKGPGVSGPTDGGDGKGSGRECGRGAAARGSAGGARDGNDSSFSRRPRALTLDTYGRRERASADGEDGDGNADGRAPAFSVGSPWADAATRLTPPPLTHTLSSPSLQVPFDAHMPPVPAGPQETQQYRAAWTSSDGGRNGPSLRESVLRSTVSQVPVLLLDDTMPIVSPGVLACARRDMSTVAGLSEEASALPARGDMGSLAAERKDGGRGDVESPPQVHAQLHPAVTRISTIVNRHLGIPTATSPHPEAELRTPGGSLFGDGNEL